MAVSLGVIILLGLLASVVVKKMHLPGLLGMIILGIVIGPYGMNLLSPQIMSVSSDLRQIALIIILLRAGLGLKKDDLKAVGAPAIKMSCIPGLIEGFSIAVAAKVLLGFSFVQGAILGFVIAAVSPAVIVPGMIEFMDKKLGTDKGIPTLILAGASIDDVVAITLMSVFMGIYGGQSVQIGKTLIGIPLSIVLGILLGVIVGIALIKLFKHYKIEDTKKVLILIGMSIMLTALEHSLKGKLEIASLLGIMTIGFVLLEKIPETAKTISMCLNKVWIFAEIVLFVLVGAEVNIGVVMNAGLIGLGIIAIGLIGRSIGVYLSLSRTKLNLKEKIFCMIAYTPKATVQAAMGAVPLAAGVANGEVILAIAVLAILVTAPLGAIGIHTSGPKLLQTLKS